LSFSSKRFELLIKTTNVIMLNQTKMKTKRKSPNPTLGGKTNHFGKTNPKDKRSGNKHK
jgi:hypothetical protein